MPRTMEYVGQRFDAARRRRAAAVIPEPDLIVALEVHDERLRFVPEPGNDPSVTCDPEGNIVVSLDAGDIRTILFRSVDPSLRLHGLEAHRQTPTGVPTSIRGTPFSFEILEDGESCLLIDRYEDTRSWGRFRYRLTCVFEGGEKTFDPQIKNQGTGGGLGRVYC